MRKEYLVAIEKQNDGKYIAYNMDSEDTIIGTGENVEDAKKDFFNSLKETKEMCLEEGIEFPEILNSTPVFRFDLASLFEYYSSINMAGFAKFVGINATLLRQYKSGNTYISENQLRKIEEGIHKLGAELSALKLF